MFVYVKAYVYSANADDNLFVFTSFCDMQTKNLISNGVQSPQNIGH